MSEQFDIHRNLRARTAADPQYFVNLQSDIVEALNTLIVAPLWEVTPPGPQSRLAIPVSIGSRPYFVSLAELIAIPRSTAGPVVENIKHARDRIIRGLDLLFTGV